MAPDATTPARQSRRGCMAPDATTPARQSRRGCMAPDATTPARQSRRGPLWPTVATLIGLGLHVVDWPCHHQRRGMNLALIRPRRAPCGHLGGLSPAAGASGEPHAPDHRREARPPASAVGKPGRIIARGLCLFPGSLWEQGRQALGRPLRACGLGALRLSGAVTSVSRRQSWVMGHE
jgi:hypothetical protein